MIPTTVTEKRINRCVSNPSDKVLQGKFNGTDGVNHDSTTTIKDGGAEHPVPGGFNVVHLEAFD